jgi:8-oxo-dGTP pyrophosphatase MutT (NUDIX family)
MQIQRSRVGSFFPYYYKNMDQMPFPNLENSLIEIQNARINTAGAYVRINGYYLFAIGTKLHRGCIPIIRPGGHREEHETGWQCATRELYEEARLQIKPLLPQTTYFSEWDQIDAEPQEIQWQCKTDQEPVPILVLAYRNESSIHLSLMYLAHANGLPQPSSEVKGLLLLKEEEIDHLCQEPVTLKQYLVKGGKAILNYEFDTSLVLEPFPQLRLLSRILSVQSENKRQISSSR